MAYGKGVIRANSTGRALSDARGATDRGPPQKKGSGAYFFPLRIMASAQYELRSGEPYSRTVLFSRTGASIPSITLPVEPLGTRQRPNISLLNLRVQKAIRWKSQDFTLRLNLYNTLNTNVVTASTVQSGANFERPTAIMPPRIAELSASYGF